MLNSDPYTIPKKDSFIDLFKKAKCTVKKSVILSDHTKHMVIHSVANCGIFCALSEIHKPTLCILLFHNSTISFKLVCFLFQSAIHLTCNNFYTVKNSYDFVDKVQHIFPSNYIMLSLDIKSLFIKCFNSRGTGLFGKKVT